ncbi:MAG: quinolinate synthase NadA [Oscillospiraceae bacterium]
MIREVQDEIIRLKKEKNITVLAHSYQAKEILEVADYTGDSFQLSVAAKKAGDAVLMCGVHFMAETVKILSPQKKVVLANPTAGCAMADQIDSALVLALKETYPDYKVVCYVNTTADVKTVCDVCVTSSSAVKIVEKMEADKILFLPDANLGGYVAEQVPHKTIKCFSGCCPIHDSVTVSDVKAIKAQHPNAQVLVHPECRVDVCRLADYVGSTSGIMEFARKSDADEFVVGTEMSIAEILSYEMPEKEFYPMSQKLICPNMKVTTLVDVLHAVQGGGLEIKMNMDTINKARVCIDEMIRLG